MKFKSVVLLAVAVGCGLVAMLGVQQMTKKGPATEEEYAQVLFATTEITSGTMLDASNVGFKRWPKDQVPQGAVTKAEQYENRSIRGNAVPGEMVMLAKLNEPGVFGASADIPEGMRVVTVPVDLTKSHSGLVQAGDRVDVMVTYKTRDGNGLETRTRTFLEAIKVFATDSKRAAEVTKDGEEVKAKNISLLVTPEQANLVMLATSKGQIHLALRNKGDTSVVETGVMSDKIFNDGADFSSGGDELFSDPTEPGEPTSVADVRSTLLEQLKPTTPVEAPEDPARKTWKIQIYAGNAVRVEEVELPEDEGSVPQPSEI